MADEIRNIQDHHSKETKKKVLLILRRGNWINETTNMNPSTKDKGKNLTEANKDLLKKNPTSVAYVKNLYEMNW